ncbi:MAG: bifunctional DNA primase/polymerase, partial [Acidobacteriaceae bacterium]|nr:bifunctional DNA primase/polymerase [Acidobacteriaceae bacterium]
MKDYSKDIYQAVQAYKELGLDPIPIAYVNGKPAKRPTQNGWQLKAETGYSAEDFITPCNVGVLLGGDTNLADIDADSRIAVAIAADVLSKKLPDTRRFGRKSKPRSHSIYFCDEPVVSESIKDPVTGETIIELRSLNKNGSRGHQTVFPPSLNYNQTTGATEQIEFDPASAAEIATVSARELVNVVRLIGALALLGQHFPGEGSRHKGILALAGLFAREKKPVEFATELICTAYEYSGSYNGDVDKARHDVQGVFKTLKESPDTHLYGYPAVIEIMPKKVVDKVLQLLKIRRAESAQQEPEKAYPLTDCGNALWLVDTHCDQIRYCPDAKAWFHFDGVRWKEGEMAIRELAKGRGQKLRMQASLLKKPEPTGDLHSHQEALKEFEANKAAMMKWANRSENAEGIRGTLFAAESDSRIICSRSDFDQHHKLLNVANGVVDLYTGELLEHDPKLMLSMLCPTEYDPQATNPVWES